MKYNLVVGRKDNSRYHSVLKRGDSFYVRDGNIFTRHDVIDITKDPMGWWCYDTKSSYGEPRLISLANTCIYEYRLPMAEYILNMTKL